MRCTALAVGFLICMLGSLAQADIIYVHADATETPHDGSDWCHAYVELYEALVAAQSNPNIATIRVANGTYKPTAGTDRSATFQLINGLTVEGGYAGCGAPDPDARDIEVYETILSGDIDVPGVSADNSYHVVTGSGTDSTAALDGFTVTGGNANGSAPYDRGGGIHNGDSASLVMIACILVGNHGGDRAGGMYNGDNSTASVMNCTFIDNTTSGRAGAVFNDNGCSAMLVNCTFIGNSAMDDGGAMYDDPNSSVTATNCSFTANVSGGNGGGVYKVASGGLAVSNCILWGNSPEAIYAASGTPFVSPVVTYSCVQGGWDGEGNIDSDPLFVDPNNDDLHLQASSPCIDAGDTTAVPGELFVDLDNNGRRLDWPGTPDTGIPAGLVPVTVDMGAYEFRFPVGDCNLDGLVNGFDIDPFVAILTR